MSGAKPSRTRYAKARNDTTNHPIIAHRQGQIASTMNTIAANGGYVNGSRIGMLKCAPNACSYSVLPCTTASPPAR